MQLRFYPQFSWCAREDVNGPLIHYNHASHNNNNLVNSTPYPLHPCAHREDSNANSVSQWWGHHRLHQDEVLECRSLRRRPKVSLIAEIWRLTTTPRLSIACMKSGAYHPNDKTMAQAIKTMCIAPHTFMKSISYRSQALL